MKMNCNVIRDLMPLVHDEAACAESKALVDEHLAECEDCRLYWTGMTAVIPAVDTGSDTIQVTVKRLRSAHLKRILRNGLIGLIIGVLLFLGGSWGWNYLTHECIRPVPLENYSFGLAQLKDGRVVVTEYAHQLSAFSSHAYSRQVDKDAGQVVYYTTYQPIIGKTTPTEPVFTSYGSMTPEMLDQLSELRQGTPDNYVTIWRKGDAIPAASEQMEAYCALEDALESVPTQESADGKATYSLDDYFRYEELRYQRQKAWYEVPEWNPQP